MIHVYDPFIGIKNSKKEQDIETIQQLVENVVRIIRYIYFGEWGDPECQKRMMIFSPKRNLGQR